MYTYENENFYIKVIATSLRHTVIPLEKHNL